MNVEDPNAPIPTIALGSLDVGKTFIYSGNVYMKVNIQANTGTVPPGNSGACDLGAAGVNYFPDTLEVTASPQYEGKKILS